jgi:hypothetical protein
VGNPPANSDAELKALFSTYGLVYSAKLVPAATATDSTQAPITDTQKESARAYGFVTFFAVSAAQLAYKLVRKDMKRDGSSMYVQFSRKRKREGPEEGVERDKIPLSIHASLELANHYIGFDNWSSSIEGPIERIQPAECAKEVEELARKLYEERKTHSKLPSIDKAVVVAYKAKVVHKFEGGRSVTAEGHGMAIGATLVEAIPMAKKIAVTHARKAAFCRTVIVIMNNKVGVRILANGPSQPVLVEANEIEDEDKPEPLALMSSDAGSVSI